MVSSLKLPQKTIRAICVNIIEKISKRIIKVDDNKIEDWQDGVIKVGFDPLFDTLRKQINSIIKTIRIDDYLKKKTLNISKSV